MDINIILNKIELCKNLQDLEEIKKEYIWKKWMITEEFKKLKDLDEQERKIKWQELFYLKEQIEKEIWNKYEFLYKNQIDEILQKDIFDITIDWVKNTKWTYWLQIWFRRYIEDILQSMWFNIETWDEIVTKYQNFFSVNIPKDHPAVEMQDTFYLEQKDETWENYVLRTHTSSWQNEVMKKYKAPCKVMLPWKVFRYENTDSSHDTTFWQLEWVVIDEEISVAHLIWFLEKFFSKVFWTSINIRLRPAYFPFVEPGFEWDISCPICWWKGCSLCKWTWWIEVFWAWMIHPNVLKEWGIDSVKYRWFAFGLWITRIVAIKYWIKDIRLFNSWDLRFFYSTK